VTDPSPVADLLDTAKAEVSGLLDRARAGVAEHVALLRGRTAGWIDDAGEAVGVITDAAATTATRLSHHAADAVGRRAEQASDHLAHAANRYSEDLGDHVVRAEQDLPRTRRERG
jgi:hypothetical protein